MEVADEKSSREINSEIETNCVNKFSLYEDVKIERESDNVAKSEINLLYADHMIKDEMVIGPGVLQNSTHNKSCSKGEPLRKTPKLDENTNREDHQKETNIEIGMDEEITVSDKHFNRVMTPHNIYTCNDCNERFKRKRELMQHIKSHEKMKRKIYLKCEKCTSQTVTRDSLERQKRLHNKSQHYVCVVCGYRYDKYKLKTHLQSLHSGKIIHKCYICDYRTNKKSNWTRHINMHTREKLFSCTMCGYRCALKSNLTDHLRFHAGEKPFFCNVCGYRSVQKRSLIEHMKIHTRENSFSCTVCEYICTKKISLTRHMMIHRSEKPFSCNVCEFRCDLKSTLIRHNMKIHNRGNPISCTECDYICTNKISMTRHMTTHRDEKPFSCTTSEYRCARKSNLTNHMEIHRQVKDHFVVLCANTMELKKVTLTTHNSLITHNSLTTHNTEDSPQVKNEVK